MRERRPDRTRPSGVARFTIAGMVAAAMLVVHGTAVSASSWSVVSSPNQGGSINFVEWDRMHQRDQLRAILVMVLGTKNTSSTGTNVVIDAYVVHP
jgi:hypothetical protein